MGGGPWVRRGRCRAEGPRWGSPWIGRVSGGMGGSPGWGSRWGGPGWGFPERCPPAPLTGAVGLVGAVVAVAVAVAEGGGGLAAPPGARQVSLGAGAAALVAAVPAVVAAVAAMRVRDTPAPPAPELPRPAPGGAACGDRTPSGHGHPTGHRPRGWGARGPSVWDSPVPQDPKTHLPPSPGPPEPPVLTHPPRPSRPRGDNRAARRRPGRGGGSAPRHRRTRGARRAGPDTPPRPSRRGSG